VNSLIYITQREFPLKVRQSRKTERMRLKDKGREIGKPDNRLFSRKSSDLRVKGSRSN